MRHRARELMVGQRTSALNAFPGSARSPPWRFSPRSRTSPHFPADGSSPPPRADPASIRPAANRGLGGSPRRATATCASFWSWALVPRSPPAKGITTPCAAGRAECSSARPSSTSSSGPRWRSPTSWRGSFMRSRPKAAITTMVHGSCARVRARNLPSGRSNRPSLRRRRTHRIPGVGRGEESV